MFDDLSGSVWSHLDGVSTSGVSAGRRLEVARAANDELGCLARGRGAAIFHPAHDFSVSESTARLADTADEVFVPHRVAKLEREKGFEPSTLCLGSTLVAAAGDITQM